MRLRTTCSQSLEKECGQYLTVELLSFVVFMHVLILLNLTESQCGTGQIYDLFGSRWKLISL